MRGDRRSARTEENPRTGPISPHTPADAVDTAVEGAKASPRRSEDDDPGLAWERHRLTSQEKAERGQIQGFQRQGGSLAPSNGHRGRTPSWISVGLATVGFIIGGVGIAMGGSLVLLIIAGVLLVAALVVAISYDILSDVVLDPPRTEAEEPHETPLHRVKRAPNKAEREE